MAKNYNAALETLRCFCLLLWWLLSEVHVSNKAKKEVRALTASELSPVLRPNLSARFLFFSSSTGSIGAAVALDAPEGLEEAVAATATGFDGCTNWKRAARAAFFASCDPLVLNWVSQRLSGRPTISAAAAMLVLVVVVVLGAALGATFLGSTNGIPNRSARAFRFITSSSTATTVAVVSVAGLIVLVVAATTDVVAEAGPAAGVGFDGDLVTADAVGAFLAVVADLAAAALFQTQ